MLHIVHIPFIILPSNKDNHQILLPGAYCDRKGELLPEHTDLRIQRTQILLRNTLVSLIAEKGFDAITVKDIAGRAMINRATFYRHYEDKYALVTSIFKEAIAEMFDEVGPVEKNIEILFDFEQEAGNMDTEKMRAAIQTLTRFYEYFAKNESVYLPLLGKNGSPWFSTQMSNYLSATWLKRIHEIRLPQKVRADSPRPASRDGSRLPGPLGGRNDHLVA